MKPMYLCPFCYVRNAGTILANTRDAKKAHYTEAHGWTEKDWKEYGVGL